MAFNNINRQYHLAIFDLDGTLADTAPDVHFSMNVLRKQMGLPPLPIEEAKKSIGPGPELFVKHITPEHEKYEMSNIIKKFRQIYSQHLLDQTQLFPGIKETIEKLSNEDISLVVVTNKPKRYSCQIIEGMGIANYFKEILGPEDVKKQKPAPDAIFKAIEIANSNPQSTLMIGDTEYDIRAARAANVNVCAVSYGYTPKEKLVKMNPEYIVDNPLDILKIFNHNFQQDINQT